VRILILGATGLTGRLLVEQALADGHDVTALARNPRKYRAGERLEMKGMAKINRADVAGFMLSQLSSGEWLRRTAVISH
jgi:uncharacterized protein YbjT (DUF2867 family)